MNEEKKDLTKEKKIVENINIWSNDQQKINKESYIWERLTQRLVSNQAI